MLLKKLEHEIAWQWKWEKVTRHLSLGASWIAWICSSLVLALATYQIYLRDQPKYWVTAGIVLLSALATSVPILSWKFKWEERHRFFDTLAREYEVIKLKLETNQLDVAGAIRQFEKLHTKSLGTNEIP